MMHFVPAGCTAISNGDARMTIRRKRLYKLWVLAFGAALPGQVLIADDARLRVLFADVPASTAIAAGDLGNGIEQIENQFSQNPDGTSGDDLATLCGAYILQALYGKAESVCDLAVEMGASGVALNNRGVLRALTGDIDGARNDFDRARPKNMVEYMHELRQKDVGLVSTDNFDLIKRIIAMRPPKSGRHITGAKVEDIANRVQ
jgi:hypothetical protein